MKKNNGAVFSALLVMLLWGTLFPMVKLGYSAYNIATSGDILFFAGVRFTICGGVICLGQFCIDRKSFSGMKSSLGSILLSGLFAIILHYSFTYLGLSMTDSSKTAILKQVGALLYVCFSFLFFKEDKVSVRKLAAAALGFGGILAINADGGNGFSFHLGDVLIIAASFCTVFSNIISKKAMAAVAPVTLTGISQLFGGLVLLAVGWALGGTMTFSLEKGYIFAYICFASILSYCLWFTVVKKGELSRLFIIKFAEPAFACIFASLILGEDILKIQYLVAFLLISVGIAISNTTEFWMSWLNWRNLWK